MEELASQELEDLLQELEEGDGTQESLPPDVEELVRALQPGGEYPARKEAAEQLGMVETSGTRVVRVLLDAYQFDLHPEVSRAAARSLQAPVHQEYLQRHPDLMEATKKVLQRVPGEGQTARVRQRQRSRSLVRSLMWSSGAGLAAGLLIGRWYAEQALSSNNRWCALGRGLDVCGAGILIPVVAGAVVGAVAAAVVRGAEQEREDRIVGMVLGALVAAFLSALSSFPSLLWRLLELPYLDLW